MPFYCKFHEDFEGLDIGKLHDHLERDHKEVQHRDIRGFIRENVVFDDIRRSDHRMVQRTWGRPPKMSQYVTDNEVEKK
jgi:hypothetical protein